MWLPVEASNNHAGRSKFRVDSRLPKAWHEPPVLVGKVLSEEHAEIVEKATYIRGGASDVPSANGIYGVIAIAMIEAATKKVLQANDIKFPSQLGGCILLFFVTLLVQFIRVDCCGGRESSDSEDTSVNSMLDST